MRNYLGMRVKPGPAVSFNINVLYPTSGPQHRYRNILFVEKEGFDELLRTARIAERYDIAIMSTKGQSVIASRMLIDQIRPYVDHIFVLHDFDVSGFSICGTFGTDSERYTFENPAEIIDLGLRLVDVERLGLQAEPVVIKGNAEARADTLERHGATEQEIDFLLGRTDGKPRRVELNAMDSGVFLDFLERKFEEHGVKKVVPDTQTVTLHARRLIEKQLAQKLLDDARVSIAAQAAATKLPANLRQKVERRLRQQPELSWDQAVAVTVLDEN